MQDTLLNSQKFFLFPKVVAILIFFTKMVKLKIACISLTVRDRAISSKVSTHRVSEHRTLGNF